MRKYVKHFGQFLSPMTVYNGHINNFQWDDLVLRYLLDFQVVHIERGKVKKLGSVSRQY